MERKLFLRMVLVWLCVGGLAKATPITIQITGHVTSVCSGLPDTIQVGTPFVGTYTYDSEATASTINGIGSHYVYNAPYGISISLGGYEFLTAPNHVGQFDIWVANNYSSNGVKDYYQVTSQYQNISIPDAGFNFCRIVWSLSDSSHSALSSDALPVTAPVLKDWNYNFVEISGPTGGPLLIGGTVTDATVIPEPLTGILMATGVLFLRRKQ